MKDMLQDLLMSALERAKEILKEHKRHRPLLILFSRSGEIGLAPLEWLPTKEDAIDFARQLVTSKDTLIYILIMEGWMSETKGEKKTIVPSEDPKRKECLILFGKTETERCCVMQPYTISDNKIKFGKVKTVSPDSDTVIKSHWDFPIGRKSYIS